ncbi:hypothetical protein LOK49_LG04G03033 [Camellia lanceoleosa]|uniref:Uncharacterized protein n=1 Tax=Camellia lanceoleosa TaxID=1840588 RepID=A0ACC0I179_9ERIC|nr:hypothetical protein LOK49_LG04G03033 [Camellia lanceoleosa]
MVCYIGLVYGVFLYCCIAVWFALYCLQLVGLLCIAVLMFGLLCEVALGQFLSQVTLHYIEAADMFVMLLLLICFWCCLLVLAQSRGCCSAIFVLAAHMGIGADSSILATELVLCYRVLHQVMLKLWRLNK